MWFTVQFCELRGLLINAIDATPQSAVGSSCVPALWVGGLLLGLWQKRVSCFMASGTLSVGQCHLDCAVYLCRSATFWKPLPSCISAGFQVLKLSALQFSPAGPDEDLKEGGQECAADSIEFIQPVPVGPLSHVFLRCGQ